MENCARYANDKMIDSDRLFFFFWFSREGQNFRFFYSLLFYMY